MMIQKMTDPDRPSAVSIADDIGVSISTLYRWVSEADTLALTTNAEPPSFTESDAEVCYHETTPRLEC